LDYSEFDIVELIQNVFDLLEMKADKKYTTSIENYHILPNLRADKDRIQHIENLIVNSIKYGKNEWYH
jgi:two-component system phosphate regulon sensor histidine kinase PhoR